MSNADLKALETRCLRQVQEQATQIKRQTLEERCGAIYAIARDCVPEEDDELVRIFANNLTELDTTDYDAREAMEEDDGIHSVPWHPPRAHHVPVLHRGRLGDRQPQR